MLIKNKTVFLILIFGLLALNAKSFAEELDISASEITIENESKIVLAEGSVVIIDSQGNKVLTEKAKYDKLDDILTTYENSKIILSNGYEIVSKSIVYDNKNKFISSEDESELKDIDGNYVSVDMFEYLIDKNLFSSRGNIKIVDANKNKYFFSEMYIDTKDERIVGSDVRIAMDQESLSLSKENEPRFVASDALLTEDKSNLSNAVFTTCKRRGESGEKCPPWTLQAKKVSHDKAKKTIFYENAILKIYDIPLFYFPKFFHPDPTVKRQSGFLIPFFTDKSSVGTGFALPYFWAISDSKDLTFTPKYYSKHEGLLFAEYRQVWENSFFHLDTSYTQGYKDVEGTKTDGSRNHVFGKFAMNLSKDPSYESKLNLNFEKVSNDTYFKVHDVNTSLVNSEETNLKSEIGYNFKKGDLALNITGKVYENLDEPTNKRYEYLLPNIELEKKVFSSKRLGEINFKSNAYYNNYDVNKTNKFLINDIFWNSRNYLTKFGFLNSVEGQIKNSNYESENDGNLKSENNNHEFSGVLAFKSKIPMQKETKNYIKTFSPNFMLRFAPGHMRDLSDEDITLNYSNLYSNNKTNKNDVIESGLSTILGFDLAFDEKKGSEEQEKFNLSLGQVFRPEKNKDIANRTSLDQVISDVVGEAGYNFSKNGRIDYKFALDHNMSTLNYNEVSTELNFGKVDFNLDYLEERNHVGNENYIKTGITLNLTNSSTLGFKTKKNYKTESTEYYNLSYQYLNDCLAAGIEFNRSFYSDRDLEPNDTLIFKISILPFGGISSPSIFRE